MTVFHKRDIKEKEKKCLKINDNEHLFAQK